MPRVNDTSHHQRLDFLTIRVLSDGFWKRHFGSDPGIIGMNVMLDANPYEVVGIAAPGAETEAQTPPDLWIPLEIDPNSNSQVEYFLALARLKPGITLSMARAQLQIAAEEYRRKFPNTITMQASYSFGADPVEDAMVKNIRPSLLILLGAVALVLLIACANVANLLLFRGTARKREIAIRLALGAGRSRIFRQLLTEGVTLAAAGGAAGFVVGSVGIRSLLNLNPAIPRIGEYGYHVAVDWRVLAFTALVALLTGIVFGLMPALESSRRDLNTGLRDTLSGAGSHRNAARSVLVISEMSLALLLLIGAGLLIRSFIDLQAVDPGFNALNV
jgi:putative ABC transport system permease protein